MASSNQSVINDSANDKIWIQGLRIVPAYAGNLEPGRARQHFDLFDSIFDSVKTVTTHTYYSTLVECKEMPMCRYRPIVDYLLLPFFCESDSEIFHILRSDKSEPTDRLIL